MLNIKFDGLIIPIQVPVVFCNTLSCFFYAEQLF